MKYLQIQWTNPKKVFIKVLVASEKRFWLWDINFLFNLNFEICLNIWLHLNAFTETKGDPFPRQIFGPAGPWTRDRALKERNCVVFKSIYNISPPRVFQMFNLSCHKAIALKIIITNSQFWAVLPTMHQGTSAEGKEIMWNHGCATGMRLDNLGGKAPTGKLRPLSY